MQLELNDDQGGALLNLITEAIEDDRFPLSPRVKMLRDILAKFGEIGGLPPDLAAKIRRYTPPPPRETAPVKVYEPPSKGRYRRRS